MLVHKGYKTKRNRGNKNYELIEKINATYFEEEKETFSIS